MSIFYVFTILHLFEVVQFRIFILLTPHPMEWEMEMAISVFLSLLKTSLVNLYLKILDLAKLFVADATI